MQQSIFCQLSNSIKSVIFDKHASFRNANTRISLAPQINTKCDLNFCLENARALLNLSMINNIILNVYWKDMNYIFQILSFGQNCWLSTWLSFLTIIVTRVDLIQIFITFTSLQASVFAHEIIIKQISCDSCFKRIFLDPNFLLRKYNPFMALLGIFFAKNTYVFLYPFIRVVCIFSEKIHRMNKRSCRNSASDKRYWHSSISHSFLKSTKTCLFLMHFTFLLTQRKEKLSKTDWQE